MIMVGIREDQARTRMAVLKWVAKGGRTHSQASSRWGHHYDDLVFDGLIALGPTEGFIRDRVRDVRTPISLSFAGRSALQGSGRNLADANQKETP